MGEHVIGPLVAAVVMALAFILGRYTRALTAKFHRRWLSAASGVSVAYIFVDVLPELAIQKDRLIEALGGESLFSEKRIYVVALIGFVVFHGLEHMVRRSRPQREERSLRPGADQVFWLHLGGFVLYTWLIGYLLAGRAVLGPGSLALYTGAMALHMVVLDSELVHEHRLPYERIGRWLLTAGLLLGCFAGIAFQFSELMISRFFAFVAGGVVITSAKAELPEGLESRFTWFLAGSASYAAVLLFI